MIVPRRNYRRIPLRDRTGSIVAHTIVDADDFERICALGSWCLGDKGYVVHGDRSTGPHRITKMHRFILNLKPGDPHVDHKDRNRLNNRKENLRVCTPAQNHQNRASKPGSSSRYRGVSLHKATGRWAAHAKLNYRKIHIGYFATEDEAHQAVSKWRVEHMPFSS